MSSGNSGHEESTLQVGASRQTLDQEPADPGSPPEGSTIGRYRVEKRLGAGAMGVVVQAHDPQLGRPVAIKLLNRVRSSREDDARMVREAQALARLSHPNVVAVFDVGRHEGKLFIAMELVRGQTLKQWIAQTTPSWQDIVRVFEEAGRGLAAAHAASIVHRDFKPDNVMVDDNGRARVMDFGLARADTDRLPSESTQPVPVALDSDASWSGRLTATGTVMGTPAYMAPEQFVGKPSNDRSDQFSFCVALYRSLYDQWPYGMESLAERIRRAHAGQLAPTPSGTRVPARVFRVLARGLRGDPSERWPSMDELLASLHRRPLRRAPWLIGGAAGALGLLLAADRSEPSPRCSSADEGLEGVWDDDVRRDLGEAFETSSAPFASRALSRSERKLDEYAAQWSEQYRNACADEDDPRQLDLRMACLRRARAELGALTTVLGEPDADVIARADTMIDALPSVQLCAEASLSSGPEIPAEARRSVEQVRRVVASARTQRRAGRHAQALDTLDQARLEVEAVDYGPIYAELELERGLSLSALGRYGDAEEHLLEALAIASQHGQRRELSTAASALVELLGVQQARFDDSRRYVPVAIEAGKDDPPRLAEAHRAHGATLMYRGDFADSEKEHRVALEILERLHGEDDPRVAPALQSLARVLAEQARYDEARTVADRFERLRNAAVDELHPSRAAPLTLEAGILGFEGRYAEAEAMYTQAIDLLSKSLGEGHRQTMSVRVSRAGVIAGQGRYPEAEAELRAVLAGTSQETNDRQHAHALSALGNTLFRQRKLEEAEEVQREALRIQEKTLGPNDPNTASTRGNLANVLAVAHKLEEAEAEHRKVVAAAEAIYGPEHPDVASAYNNLGIALSHLGKDDELLVAMERALHIRERTLPDDHPLVALSRSNVASILLDAGRPQEALPLAEKAWQRRNQPDVPIAYKVSTAYVLARALWDAREDAESRRRSLELADRAIELCEEMGDENRVKDVRAWRRERVGRSR